MQINILEHFHHVILRVPSWGHWANIETAMARFNKTGSPVPCHMGGRKEVKKGKKDVRYKVATLNLDFFFFLR